MSGVWHEGKWVPTTGFVCRRCGSPVYESELKERGYRYQCLECDEDLFGFEVVKAPLIAPHVLEEEQHG